MTEEISKLLGIRNELILNLIRVLGIVTGMIIFLLFFAFLPMYAVILFGFLTIIVSVYYKSDKGLYAGLTMLIIGFAAIFIPQIAEQLSVIARTLNEMLVYPT